jgi:hypothetical protein
MDNPEKLATLGTQDEDKQNKTKTQHNICWTPLIIHKQNTNNEIRHDPSNKQLEVGGFLWVLQFLPPITLTATI